MLTASIKIASTTPALIIILTTMLSIDMVEGIEVFEPSHIDECCGFGGMFAVEEQAVSVCMGRDKVKDHMATGAEYIVGADSSCLMHMQGVIKREHLPIQIIHIVEILASQS